MVASQAQNTIVECRKTIWPLNDSSYQIDSYNSQKQKLQSIMVNGNGDTTQWFVHEYNNKKLKIKSYTIIDNYSELYETTYKYDSLGELLSTTTVTKNEIRNQIVSEMEKRKNEYGYPEYLPNIGFLEFKFDTDSNIIYQKITPQDSSAITEYFFEYNASGKRSGEKHFIADTLYTYSKSYFNENNLLMYTENYDYLNRLEYTEYYEFNSDGFMTSKYAKETNEEDLMWQLIFKRFPCELDK